MTTAASRANLDASADASERLAEGLTLSGLAAGPLGTALGGIAIGGVIGGLASGVQAQQRLAESAGFATQAQIDLSIAQREFGIQAGRLSNQLLEPFRQAQADRLSTQADFVESVVERIRAGEDVPLGERLRAFGTVGGEAAREIPLIGDIGGFIADLNEAALLLSRGGGGQQGNVTIVVSPELGATTRWERETRNINGGTAEQGGTDPFGGR